MSDTINIKNDRHVYPKYHIGAPLGLLHVDAVQHESKTTEGGGEGR